MDDINTKKNQMERLVLRFDLFKRSLEDFNKFHDPYLHCKEFFEDDEIKELEEYNKEILNYKNKMTKIYNDVTIFFKDELKTIQEELKELENKQKELEIKRLKEIEEQKKNKKCNTLNELYFSLQNVHQQDIFTKILTDSEYAKIYLASYNTSEENYDMLGTITVLGTYNQKKDKREEYEIRIYNNSPKGTFWCSCLDHKFNSSKKGTVCKHICFIVCKILKLLDPNFFETKKLTKEQLDSLIEKLSSKDLAQIDKSLVNKIIKITLETFKNFVKPSDEGDSCPICFDDINEKTKVACPMCHNYIHSDCMNVCLEKRDTCLFCLDPIWAKFKTLGKNNTNVI